MMAAQTIASDSMIYWDMNDGKIGMIDVRDIVDAATAVLTGSGHEAKSYILTGHPARSFAQFARDFAPVFGSEVGQENNN